MSVRAGLLAGAIEQAAVRLGLGDAHFLAGQHFLDGLARDRRASPSAGGGDAVAIIDPAAIAEDEILVEQRDRRHALHAQRVGQSLAEVLQHRKGHVAIVACMAT